MRRYEFALVLATSEESEADANWLHEAGCSDGSISTSAGATRIDFHREALSEADAITCYLMIRPMIALAQKLDRELREGTPVVALAFLFRDRVPSATARGDGVRRADAALYRWPARG